jgi:hypothetical protein
MSRGKHDKLWIDFIDWCRSRRLKALPAHAWTVAAYLRWRDRQEKDKLKGKVDFVSADRVIKVISRAHLLGGYKSPHDHPVIAKTLASIERSQATAPDRSDLFHDKDFVSSDKSAPDTPEPEVDPIDTEPDVVSGIRTNFSLRTQPKLVSRRPGNV